jgi:hypothetical protein
MASYSFVTKWFILASVERVWDALNDPERYHLWWPCFVEYRPLSPGASDVGSRGIRVVRGFLPYQLRYTTTITEKIPPHQLAYDSDGDLTGRGRFVLASQPSGTDVTFYWDVETTGRVMNLLAPLLRPLFSWNHNWVMAAGEKGLRRWLAEPAARSVNPCPVERASSRSDPLRS